MQPWLEMSPWLAAMAVLLAVSAFFSGSEAALFSLRQPDRRRLATGSRSQRLAASLLESPDRLLSTILFANLMVNMAYFAVTSIISFRLENSPETGGTMPFVFAGGSLLMIILLGEMLPKTLAVLGARSLAGPLAPPVALAVRLASPMLPTLRLANLLARRLVWPRFKPEPYLEVTDLERAIAVSAPDAQLAEHERMVLKNIVGMSDLRVDEWMRPRTQFLVFTAPVQWQDLQGRMTPSGYLLVTTEEGGEVTLALDLKNLSHLPSGYLERFAEPVIYMPWCASVADAFQQMRDQRRDVVAVVNEFGDVIGILTFEDILDTLFTDAPSRSTRLLNRPAVEQVSDGVWLATGVAGIRRLARQLGLEMAPSRSATVAGVIQELLHRPAVEGDVVEWGALRIRVLEAADRSRVLVELTRREVPGGEAAP